MSLVGSHEDLGLADILQIVGHARKSGVLLLRCEGGEGWFAFREGLVHAALAKGQPEDLDALLRRAGHGGPAPAPERLEALRRELVEQCLARMIEWRTGEFSFEMRDDPVSCEGLALAVGLSPQYLAMEAMRRNDGRRAGDGARSAEALIFSGEEEAAPGALEALVDATVERADPPSDAELAERVAAASPNRHQDRPAALRAACANVVIVDPDQALWDVSFRVDQGEIATLVGSNGAGKSTTLKAISGLTPPLTGEISFEGIRIDRVPAYRIVDGYCSYPGRATAVARPHGA